jgi:hypothetical protein
MAGTKVRSPFRSRVEKKLAHLSGHIAGDGSLLRPCESLIHIGGFQYPKPADVLLAFDSYCSIFYFNWRIRPCRNRRFRGTPGGQKSGAPCQISSFYTTSAPAELAACSTGSAHQPIRRTARRAPHRMRDRGAIDHPPAACFRSEQPRP